MVDNTWIKQSYSVFIITCSFVFQAQSDVPRPRGVSLSKASLYSPSKDFTCFDGTGTIPFSYVNDDYCDCFDGSDEPGTSACLNAVFHCTNAGHRPLNIPSSRVNDGVCDCCDGTDEYSPANICSNSCEELGKEARAEAQRLAELFKAGHHLRQELIENGNKKRNEMADQLAQLEKDKDEAEALKTEKETQKNDLETRENEALKVYREAEELERQKKAAEEKENTIKEATEHFNRYDSNSDGALSKDEIKVVNVFDKNKDGEVDEEETQYFFLEKESVDLETFIESTWHLLKPLLMVDQGMFRPENPENEETESEPEQEENQADLDTDYGGHDEGDDEDDNDDEVGDNDTPPDGGEEQETEHQETSTTYDEETQKLVQEANEARRQLTEAERNVREIEANIRNIQQNLEKDYGLQQEFATLDGQCLEFEDKEYIYKLCLFQKVTQKSKNGGADVGLGNWGEWGGPNNNKYSIMKYTNGIACWNGPSRMASVHVNCGLETQIISVTEPYRCEYKIDLLTPAACDDTYVSLHQSSHDEL